MMTFVRQRGWQWAALCLALAGCGGGDSSTEPDDAHPYQPGNTTVIGQGDTPQEFDTTAGAGCLKDASDQCVDLSKRCGPDDKVDVVVDKKGVVVSVVCYPTGGPVSSSSSKPPSGRTFANNEVVVLDDADDGDDLVGDVDIDSNNVTVWGDSPATAVVGGNLTISKNNGIVRGVRIKGNVTINGNNGAVLLSVIEGDVTITGNNNVLASCDVYGKVIYKGKNGGVVSNRVASGIDVDGGTACSDNVTLLDPDGDKAFDEGESGEPLSCGAK